MSRDFVVIVLALGFGLAFVTVLGGYTYVRMHEEPHGTPIAVAEPMHSEMTTAATVVPPPKPQTIMNETSLASAPTDFMSMAEYAYNKADAESYCREEWTKRGELDTGMFNYCVSTEHNGYQAIPVTLKKFGKYAWMATLFPAIWAKWTKRGVTQYSMVGYDLKQETDKFLDYEYERKQPTYDSTKMSDCLSQWGDSESRWSMTMYCYKQD